MGPAGDSLPVRTIVVDDLQLARYAARMLVSNTRQLEWVGEAADIPSALDLTRRTTPDLAIVDVELGASDGADATQRLLRERPSLCVVAWSVSEDSEDLLRMMSAGARGYMLKESGPAEFERAIETALSGDHPIPRRIAVQAIMSAAATGRSRVRAQSGVALTPAERRVLQRLVAGDSVKLAATTLRVSPASVDTHVRSIYRKLNANNRAQAIRAAIVTGLISVDELD